MAHWCLLQALDQKLHDIMGRAHAHEPFCGKVIVLAGDFRQVLPFVLQASHVQVVRAFLKNARTRKQSSFWEVFHLQQLRDNMRVLCNQNNPVLREFDDWLLQLGNGTLPHDADCIIRIDDDKCHVIKIVADRGILLQIVAELHHDYHSLTG